MSPWKHAVGGGLEGRDGTGGAPGTSSWHAGSTRRTTASSRGHRAQEPTRPLQPRGAGAEHHSHRSVGPCPRPATCTPTLQSGNYTHSTDGETEPQKEEATCFLKFTNIQACLTPTSPLRALTLPPITGQNTAHSHLFFLLVFNVCKSVVSRTRTFTRLYSHRHCLSQSFPSPQQKPPPLSRNSRPSSPPSRAPRIHVLSRRVSRSAGVLYPGLCPQAPRF